MRIEVDQLDELAASGKDYWSPQQVVLITDMFSCSRLYSMAIAALSSR